MNKPQRYTEIDILRGIAVIMMIVFHFIFDLNYFSVYRFDVHSGFLLVLARATAIIFLFLVGISLTISYSRVKEKPRKEIYKKYLLRGMKIFSLGLFITLITWFVFKENTIWFGVLHLIGLSIILAMFFLKWKKINFILGLLVLSVGFYLKNFTFDFAWLLWIGLMPQRLYTFDYFPLFPWFGVVLLGMFIGKVIYPEGKRRMSNVPANFLTRFFSFLGRNSLIIYLIHQPLLIILLYALGFVY